MQSLVTREITRTRKKPLGEKGDGTNDSQLLPPRQERRETIGKEERNSDRDVQ